LICGIRPLFLFALFLFALFFFALFFEMILATRFANTRFGAFPPLLFVHVQLLRFAYPDATNIEAGPAGKGSTWCGSSTVWFSWQMDMVSA